MGVQVIVYGVCVTSPEVFERGARQSIATHGGADATLISVTDRGRAAGYNQILDALPQLQGSPRAVVLLDERLRIQDSRFSESSEQAFADGFDVVGVVGASGGTDLRWWLWNDHVGDVRTPDFPEVRLERSGAGEVDAVDGILLALSPRAWSRLRFDAIAFPGEHGWDIDLCFAARRAGLKVGAMTTEVALSGRPVAERGPSFELAQRIFLAKWDSVLGTLGNSHPDAGETPAPTIGIETAPQDRPVTVEENRRAAGTRATAGSDSYYEFPRPELVAMVPRSARRILDVGCAGGALGAAIKQAIPDAEVSGVEYVQSAVDHAARRLDFALRADLNALEPLPFSPGYFDVLVFGDVLEHLLNPMESLRGLLPYLADDGVLLASIPNVKHWSVMIPALAYDRWTYTDEGLLDRTHVHLFTEHEALQVFTDVGFGDVRAASANTILLDEPSHLEPLVSAAVTYGAEEDTARRLFNTYQFLLLMGRS